MAIEETRLGVLEDKTLKNMVATEFVYNYVKDKRTVGIIREFPESGLVEMAEPIGVIFSLTPDHESHFYGSVQVHHGHQDAQRGDFQPSSERLALLREAMRIMYEAAVKHGAPEGVFTCVEAHTLMTTPS